jgi:hypothetical protein
MLRDSKNIPTGQQEGKRIQLVERQVRRLVHSVLLLSPWSRVLPEKQTASHLVQELQNLYRTSRLITMFVRGHHWILSLERQM